ncbi:MAG: ATP-binding cassette domain-containing protein [Erysipelotrichaceae bacterium]
MKLEVKDLRKTFGETEVLHGISFSIESGKALGLLGRNGAGKSTSIRILMDVFKANSGEILVDGKKFIPSNYQIGYLPEERGLYPKKKVCDQLMYMAQLRGFNAKAAKDNVNKWLKKLGIEEYYDRKLESLSKGNQQKVQIVQTLVCDPTIVILDEPFSGLDPVNSQILKDVIKEIIAEDKIVIFSSHQMSYVEEFCEEIVIIKKGEVCLSGNLKEIKKTAGKNYVILSSENFGLEELANKIKDLNNSKLDVIGDNGEELIINTNGLSKNEVLSLLMNNTVKINKFGDYEPSLTDIFVAKAGD